MSGTNFPMPKRIPDQTGSSPADSSSKNQLKFSRRRFGRNAAAMAALSVSPVSLLGMAGAPAVASPEPQSQAKAGDYSKLGITPEQGAEVEAKLANIVRKFGSRLSVEQREHLRRILAYNERMLAGVRAFELQNGDPPASVLRVSPMRESAEVRPRRGGKNKNQEGAR